MEGELIIVSFISLAGMVLMYTINNANWFKRENFKMQRTNILAENRLKLKKLAKELDVTIGNPIKEEKGILDSIKGLDKDKIAGILGMLQGSEDLEDTPEGIEGAIMNFASKNPELVNKFISGFGSAKKEGGQIPIEER